MPIPHIAAFASDVRDWFELQESLDRTTDVKVLEEDRSVTVEVFTQYFSEAAVVVAWLATSFYHQYIWFADLDKRAGLRIGINIYEWWKAEVKVVT